MSISGFTDAAQAAGWILFQPENELSLRWGGTSHPTLIVPCGLVRVAIGRTGLYYHDGRVWVGCPDSDVRDNRVIITAIVVDGAVRRMGLATSTVKSLCEIADSIGYEIELEATPMPAFKAPGQRLITGRKLQSWYRGLGFEPKFLDIGGPILVRRPAQ